MQTNRIVAAEALIRWIDPDLGMIPPDQFIPVTEETGLIIPIGEWVLKEACRQLKRWHEAAGTFVTMSINLSPVQFNATDLLGRPQSASDLENLMLQESRTAPQKAVETGYSRSA
ncbi:MAG: EAL domain-containing protein [Gammaproteobacteria bacterium]|nr:EAL domain-containing protein [Gammaproteobacteria bacterium]